MEVLLLFPYPRKCLMIGPKMDFGCKPYKSKLQFPIPVEDNTLPLLPLDDLTQLNHHNKARRKKLTPLKLELLRAEPKLSTLSIIYEH